VQKLPGLAEQLLHVGLVFEVGQFRFVVLTVAKAVGISCPGAPVSEPSGQVGPGPALTCCTGSCSFGSFLALLNK
jgi:hypothetical protein